MIAGFIAPTAICRHSSGDPDCSKSHPSSYAPPPDPPKRKRSDSPDADEYEIVDVRRTGRNLVLKVRYPNCAACAYEGQKVMVFLNVTEVDVLKWRQIDPHFRDPRAVRTTNHAPSPAARFPASQEGWNDACDYAIKKESGTTR